MPDLPSEVPTEAQSQVSSAALPPAPPIVDSDGLSVQLPAAGAAVGAKAETQEGTARPLPVVAVWARDLLVSLAISAFIIVFLYQPVKVEGTSMMPGLEDQERIFVNKFVYRWEPIQRGDIVVFRYPRDTSKSYIKRVIGIAGDRIRIENGQVYVNGEALDEDYVPSDYADARSFNELVVPPNSFFVLGDHRSMSNDSRDFGTVNERFIYGKAVFGYWPMEKLGRLR